MRIGTGVPKGTAGKVPGSKYSGNLKCDVLAHGVARGTRGTDGQRSFVGNGDINRDQGVVCINWIGCTYAGNNGVGGNSGGRTAKGVSAFAGSALLLRGIGIPRG